MWQRDKQLIVVEPFTIEEAHSLQSLPELGLIISQIRAGFVKLTSKNSAVKKNLTVSRPSMFLLPREASEGQSRKTGDFKRTG